MLTLLAQIPDPSTLLTTQNILIAVGVIGAILLYRNKDKIKAELADDKAKLDTKIQEVKDKVSEVVPVVPGDDTSINDFFLKMESGAMANPVVRKLCSSVCRGMINAAKQLPNKAKAEEAHQALRALFLEFGDPTPADPSPTDPTTDVTPPVVKV